MQCMLKIFQLIHIILCIIRGNSFPVLTLTFGTFIHKYSGADLSKFKFFIELRIFYLDTFCQFFFHIHSIISFRYLSVRINIKKRELKIVRQQHQDVGMNESRIVLEAFLIITNIIALRHVNVQKEKNEKKKS